MSLSTINLIHLGTELVLIGGMAFWFNRRISAMEVEIIKTQGLKAKIDELEQQLARQRELLIRHDEILTKIIGGPPHHLVPKSGPPKSVLQPKGMAPREESLSKRLQPQAVPKTAPKMVPKQQAPSPPPLVEEEPPVSNEELDSILQDVLADLNQPKVVELSESGEEATVQSEPDLKSAKSRQQSKVAPVKKSVIYV